MLKALAPGLKTIRSSSIPSEIEIAVILETPKLAISVGPLGTVGGVQLAAVFQSPLLGLRFQVALPDWAFGAKSHERRATVKILREDIFIPQVEDEKRWEGKQNPPLLRKIAMLAVPADSRLACRLRHSARCA